MKSFWTALIGLIPLIMTAQEPTPIIRSSHMQWLTLVPDGSNCDNPSYQPYQQWADTAYNHRAMLMHSGDSISFWPEQMNQYSVGIEWHIDRLTGPNLPDHSVHYGSSLDTMLTKFVTGSNTLWEKYLVSMYRYNQFNQQLELLDWTHVHVLNGAMGQETPLHYGFDQGQASLTAPLDALGRTKVTSGPVFSGNGNRRSDLNPVSEKMLNSCIYPAYGMANDASKPSASSRSGDGYLRIFNPAVSTISGVEDPYDQVCESYNPFTYDFCQDPCGVYDQAIEYDQYESHESSICSNVELNVYPTHLIGEEYFYGFSFRIPVGFVEHDMVGPEGELGHDRREVIAEFLQPAWPLDPALASYPCAPSFQLMYLGNQQVGIQFGVKGLNRSAFGPWPIEKGEWVDVALHVKWEDIGSEESVPDSEGGIFEIWLGNGEEYVQQCLRPATEFFQSKRALGEGEDALSPFETNADETQLLGPNLINPNPAYLSLKSKRAVAYEGACGLDFTTQVDFDELRIGRTLNEVLVPGTWIAELPASCDPVSEFGGTKSEAELGRTSLQVFPNPASQWAQVSWEEGSEPESVMLLDLQGRTVQAHSPSRDQTTVRWSLDQVPTGTYVVRVSGLNWQETTTLVVQ